VTAALIVGFGSIGQRHYRILNEIGVELAVVSSQSDLSVRCFRSVPEAMLAWSPDYVVIASPTSRHYNDFFELSRNGFKGRVLIEKPVFANMAAHLPMLAGEVYVGYNLRYLEVIRRLRQFIETAEVLSVDIYNGEYLPDWRPGRDYRTTSSAQRALGGGVLRDLSHEIDFLHHLVGAPSSLVSNVGRLGNLEIDTEDSVRVIGQHQRGCVSTLTLSYLDRVRRREITLTTPQATLRANLLTGSISDGFTSPELEAARDDTFRMMHREILSRHVTTACTLSEGLAVLRTVEMIEQSSRDEQWVSQ
jgi:predicted dehydrogenase